MRTWRLTKRKYNKTCLNGTGAAAVGGRWNSVGTRVAYTSSSRALAALEMLIRTDPASIPNDFVFVGCEFSDALIVDVETLGKLPEDWKAYPSPTSTQRLGDAWATAGRFAVLSVPSVVVNERNYIVNPLHHDVKLIALGSMEDFVFDEHLFGAVGH